MQSTKLTIQFAAISHLWGFRNAIQVNEFYVNIAKGTLTFECTDMEQVQMLLKQYYGEIIRTREEA